MIRRSTNFPAAPWCSSRPTTAKNSGNTAGTSTTTRSTTKSLVPSCGSVPREDEQAAARSPRRPPSQTSYRPCSTPSDCRPRPTARRPVPGGRRLPEPLDRALLIGHLMFALDAGQWSRTNTSTSSRPARVARNCTTCSTRATGRPLGATRCQPRTLASGTGTQHRLQGADRLADHPAGDTRLPPAVPRADRRRTGHRPEARAAVEPTSSGERSRPCYPTMSPRSGSKMMDGPWS